MQLLGRSHASDGRSRDETLAEERGERTLICGRATGPQRPFDDRHTGCMKNYRLLVPGETCYGRTGNQLITLVKALQYTKDKGMLLGLMRGTCLMEALQSMFMIRGSAEEWEARIEEALCVKVIRSDEDLEGWNPLHKPNLMKIYKYEPNWKVSHDERVARMLHTYRTLFQNYNDGSGVDWDGNPTRDMCSGIQSLFGVAAGETAYSAVHLRTFKSSFEGEIGHRMLAGQSERTGCDRRAALEMPPDYVKAILGPLGMLHNPIVLITDGHNREAIERLQQDPEIGPMLRVVPEEACWIGGDFTLGVMADVFVGNPASTASMFVARSRVALGMGENYIYMRHDEERGWERTCDDDCLFAPPNRTGTGLEDWTLDNVYL